jgi:apolipoprotein N-acyltransferase
MSEPPPERRVSRKTTIPLIAVVVALGVTFVSPRFGVWLLVAAMLWAGAGLLTSRRRTSGKNLLRSYWWIGVLWIVLGLWVLLIQIAR